MRTETAQPEVKYLKDYKAPNFTVESMHLNFDIHEGKTTVTQKANYTNYIDNDDGLTLNGEHLTLTSIAINGTPLTSEQYNVSDEQLTIHALPSKFEIEIITEICPEENTALEGLYKSGDTYCTQCEAEGFRRITYYPDRPDIMTIFTVRVEANKTKYPVLLSNGNLQEQGDLDNDRHYTIWHDPHKKPCYLFALVAADLVHIEDTFITKSGRDVTLRIYVRDGDLPQCDHAMESLKKSMKWDEDVYGLEYDLDLFNIVAVSDFNMGAMENKSLNIFNTALVLAHQETATDTDYGRVESVIGHEYFHNWSGNRVTCRDWFQLSLKEGLTVFRDQEFSSDMNSRGVQRIDDVQQLRRMQFPEDAGPLAHPIRPDNYIEMNNFYTMTVYEKGAEVIRMFHTLLGAKTYRKATDLYFSRHDGQAVTCDDWIQCMEDASGMDLSQFRLWYSQAGTPNITASGEYNDCEKTYKLTLSQDIPSTPGQDEKQPMHIPVSVGLLSPNGHDFEIEKGKSTTVLHLKEREQTFTFEGISSKPVPSILRNFSAPVKLDTDLTDTELRFLMVHDTDGFNRWEAGQKLSMRVLLSLLNQEIDRPKQEYINSYKDLLEKCLKKDRDPALMARSISIPCVSTIIQECTEADPQSIYKARQKLIKLLATENVGLLNKIYDNNLLEGAFRKDGEAIGMRALKNTALSLLIHSSDEEAINVAQLQYEHANNMTDRVGAISALNHINDSRRDSCYQDFYDRFKNYPLVIDKWFNLQASAVRPSTHADLIKLSQHSDFSLKNPNRARSLYGAFAMLNPVKFHDSTGAGYDFLTNAIIELNAINPQIAARMLGPMREWKRYSQDRQEKIKACLEKILETNNLSKDVYEIASKSLT